jgi:hypothetical protein
MESARAGSQERRWPDGHGSRVGSTTGGECNGIAGASGQAVRDLEGLGGIHRGNGSSGKRNRPAFLGTQITPNLTLFRHGFGHEAPTFGAICHWLTRCSSVRCRRDVGQCGRSSGAFRERVQCRSSSKHRKISLRRKWRGAIVLVFSPTLCVARRAAWPFLRKTDDTRLSMLRRFAHAMGVPVEELVREGQD